MNLKKGVVEGDERKRDRETYNSPKIKRKKKLLLFNFLNANPFLFLNCSASAA
jgi:hypothetical protein